MTFWIILFLITYLLCMCENISPMNKLPLNKILVLIIFIVVAFRYMIGWDYDSYINKFDTVEENDIYMETSFVYLCLILRHFGFDYQMLFLIYALITMFFIYKAADYYVNNATLYWGLYLLYPMGMLYSMGQIRQAAAIAIFLWSTKYIVENKFFQYVFYVLLATMIHNSAVILIMVYPMLKYTLTLRKIFALSVVAIVAVTSGLWERCLIDLGEFFDIAYVYYVLNGNGQLPSWGNFAFYFLMWMICAMLYSNSRKERKDYVIFVMITCCWLSTILFYSSFVLLRIRDYFSLFYILYIVRDINNVNSYRKRIIFTSLSLLLFAGYFFIYLYNWNTNPSAQLDNMSMSAGNINYEFCFKFLK